MSSAASTGPCNGVAKQRHFLVVDVDKIVLVEPDATCLVWMLPPRLFFYRAQRYDRTTRKILRFPFFSIGDNSILLIVVHFRRRLVWFSFVGP